MKPPHHYLRLATILIGAMCTTGLTIDRREGADGSPAQSPSVGDIVNAPSTLKIAGVDLTLMLVCNQNQHNGPVGPNLYAKPTPQDHSVITSATLQVQTQGTQDWTTLSAVGVWYTSSTTNGRPTLFTSSVTIHTAAEIEQVKGGAYRKQTMVVGINDAAGHLHLVKVDCWIERLRPPLP
jgi:hypothetical protein